MAESCRLPPQDLDTSHQRSRKRRTSRTPQLTQRQSKPQTPDPSSTGHEAAELVQNEAAFSRKNTSRVGQLWKSRGAPAFFGSSYFGPQVAAALLDSPAPYVQPGANTSRRSLTAKPFRDETGPFSQLWDLLGLLPRQKSTVDRLVACFLNDVSWQIDAVHPPSFRQEYDRFYARKAGFDDVTTVDIRWLALLFIVLAIGTYLDCPRKARPEEQREYEESSMSFFWACRKAIVIAPSFYGESTDLVQAGILATRFCLFSQRITESWLTVGFAARLAMAQGFHIDGANWQLPRRVTESRRRLWCHLYLLDRMISLALGRPYCILDSLSLTSEPTNVFLDDLGDEDARSVEPMPLETHPTPSLLAIFSYRLAKVIGRIQEQTFGLQTPSYRQVMIMDAQLNSWKQSLPGYLAIEHPDLSKDRACPFLKWHRLYLHTAFHFACITLHRPYTWRSSITDQHRYSRQVCFASACADLKTRLEHDDNCEPTDHYTWCLGAPQLFNSGIVLGVLTIQEQSRAGTDLDAVLNDLHLFCDKQNHGVWVNDFGLAEVKVVEMCIDKLKKRRSKARETDGIRASQVAPDGIREPRNERNQPDPFNPVSLPNESESRAIHPPSRGVQPHPSQLLPPHDATFSWDLDDMWPSQPFVETFSFPGPTDLETWQDMINAIGTQSEDEFLEDV